MKIKGTATEPKHVTYTLTATQATDCVSDCLQLPVASPPELYGPAALHATVQPMHYTYIASYHQSVYICCSIE